MTLKQPTWEVVSGYATAPSTTLTTVTASDANVPFTVRTFPNDPSGKNLAFIADVWAKRQAAGDVQVIPPRGHDTNAGFQEKSQTGDPYPLWPRGNMQPVDPNDSIAVKCSGSATAGQFEFASVVFCYERLKGLGQNMLHWQELVQRQRNPALTVKTSVTGNTNGTYAETAINGSAVYNLRNNTKYAILGYSVDTACQAVTYKGPETSFLRVGGPGVAANKEVTRERFVFLSRWTDEKTIPYFDAANGASFVVGILCDQAGGTFVVTTHLVELVY